MIAYLKGTIIDKNANEVIVETGSIGYRISISSMTAEGLPGIGKQATIHTYFLVREDAMQLYGFLYKEDLQVFKLLLGVNGVGPKAAIGILSVFSSSDLQFAILAEDVKTISKAPGIGRKTAQKIILELKDKLQLEEAFEQRLGRNDKEGLNVSAPDARGEAVEALIALGYSSTEALRAVKLVDITDSMDAEQILKASLKNLSFL